MEAPLKKPHDVDRMLGLIREAVRPYPKAALFQLASEGYTTPFQQLVACMISARTLDETTLVTARRLFQVASTPQAVAALAPGRIDELIRACTFHEPKSRNLHAIAEKVVRDYGGELPCDRETLMGLPGVGPKITNLVLSIACRQPMIGVDVHVHRVTNRWGYVEAGTPEKTLRQLEAKVPREHWTEINELLMPFGKHVCTRLYPKCSTCSVWEYCRQIGVGPHR